MSLRLQQMSDSLSEYADILRAESTSQTICRTSIWFIINMIHYYYRYWFRFFSISFRLVFHKTVHLDSLVIIVTNTDNGINFDTIIS